MAQRLPTGLAGLDAQLGGGVPPGSVHLLMGEPLNAQELFCYHFAGASVDGCHFLSTQNTAEQVKEGLARIGAPDGGVHVQDLKAHGLPDLDDATRVVIDSFSTYVLERGWDAAWKDLQALGEIVRSYNTTAVFTVVPDLHTKEQMALMRLWADGVLEMYIERQGFGVYPFLLIKKMRGVPDAARILLFKDQEKGLFFESTRRVF